MYDVTGLVAIGCDHGPVHLGVLMTTGENYRYAVMLLLILLMQGVCPENAYYDIACRFAAYFRKYLQQDSQLSAAQQRAAERMQLMVPPFHAWMHTQACREKWTLLNREFGSQCNPNGEPLEQVWALVRGFQRLKYATVANLKLSIELALTSINVHHDARLSRLLRQRILKLQDEILKTQRDISVLERRAPVRLSCVCLLHNLLRFQGVMVLSHVWTVVRAHRSAGSVNP